MPMVRQAVSTGLTLSLAWLGLLGLVLPMAACSSEPSSSSAEVGRDSTVAAPGFSGGTDWDRVRVAFSTLSTVAGKGSSDSGNEWQSEFEGGRAVDAELSRPHIALADAQGNVYIADKESHAVRRVTTDGVIHTFAGTNVAGKAPDSATPAMQAALSNPNGLWVTPGGTVYIVDLDNYRIRRVTPDGVMTTLIVMNNLPVGRGLWVAEDESEALIAAGSELRRWTPVTGVTTLASGFGALGMVVKSAAGKILVGDRDGQRVYEIAGDGTKTVVAGNGSAGVFVDGTLATEAALNEPRAIWPYADGLLIGLHDGCKILYVDNEGYAHLMLRGSAKSNAGDGLPYDPTQLTIGEVRSITVDHAGAIIFVENDVGRVRKLAPAR